MNSNDPSHVVVLLPNISPDILITGYSHSTYESSENLTLFLPTYLPVTELPTSVTLAVYSYEPSNVHNPSIFSTKKDEMGG